MRVIVGVPAASPLRFWLFTQLQVSNNALFCAIVWNILKWRNSFVFKQAPRHPCEVPHRIALDVGEFQRWGEELPRLCPALIMVFKR